MTDEIPNATVVTAQMREAGEKSIGQAKSAYEQYASTTERVLNTMDDWTRQAWSGAREVNIRMLTFADENAKAGFDYAERFVKAKDAKEVLALQQTYLETQGKRLSDQMKELRELSSRAARETAEAAKPDTHS